MVSVSLHKFLDGVIGIVEASMFEKNLLWQEYHQKHGKTWEQGVLGHSECVGKCEDCPVVISLFVDKVDGHRILFWHATSSIVNYYLIDDWFATALPKTAFRDDKLINRTDAGNFHNVFPQ